MGGTWSSACCAHSIRRGQCLGLPHRSARSETASSSPDASRVVANVGVAAAASVPPSGEVRGRDDPRRRAREGRVEFDGRHDPTDDLDALRRGGRRVESRAEVGLERPDQGGRGLRSRRVGSPRLRGRERRERRPLGRAVRPYGRRRRGLRERGVRRSVAFATGARGPRRAQAPRRRARPAPRRHRGRAGSRLGRLRGGGGGGGRRRRVGHRRASVPRPTDRARRTGSRRAPGRRPGASGAGARRPAPAIARPEREPEGSRARTRVTVH